jgi:hypothetical protein
LPFTLRLRQWRRRRVSESGLSSRAQNAPAIIQLTRWFNYLTFVSRNLTEALSFSSNIVKTAKITIIAEGFVIDWQRNDVPNTSVAWTAVKRATAYKRDLFAYDLICLAISFDPGYGVELDEEMEGFSELCNEFEINISGSIPHATWFEKVRLPPFKPSPIEVYKRPSPDQV